MSTPHSRWPPVAFVPPARHLLRGKDLADARYSDQIDVDDMAGAAGLSRAHFSREFRRAFGESPTAYRAKYPPAAQHALIPTCVVRVYGRPQLSTFREDNRSAPG
jgi:AraC-like DNA-binding protein